MSITLKVVFIRAICLRQHTKRRHKLINPWMREQRQRDYAETLRARRA